MAILSRLNVFSRLKLRGRLLAGYLVCTALAAVSGGAGIVSLRQIQSGAKATGDQITALIDEQGSQGRWFMALRHLVSTVTKSQNETSLTTARQQLQEIRESTAGADQQNTGVLHAVDQLLNQRSGELVAAADLAASSRKAETLLKDLMDSGRTAADAALLQVNDQMKETVTGIKSASEKVPQALAKDLDRLSAESGKAISTIKAALSVRSRGQELNIHVKDSLLSEDQAVVDFSRNAITTLLNDATAEVAKLPEVEGKEALSKAFAELRGLVTKMIDLHSRALASDKKKLPEVEARDTLSKAFVELRGLVSKMIDLHSRALASDKKRPADSQTTVGAVDREKVSKEAPRTKNGNPSDREKTVKSISETLKKIDEATLAIADSVQFDSAMAMDDLLKEIKKRTAESAAVNSGQMNSLVTSTDAGLSTIKAAIALRANCMQLNNLAKETLQASDPAAVDQARSSLPVLIGKVKQDIAQLSLQRTSATGAQSLDTLQQVIGDAFSARQRILSADRKLDEASEQVARELATLDKAMVAKGEGVKTRAEETEHTTDSLIGRWQAVQLALAVANVALALIVGTLSAAAITRPLRRITSMLEDIAQGEGDLTKRLEAARQDEIGDLAKWFNLFVEKLQKTIRNVAAGTRTLSDSASELSTTAAQLARGAEQTTSQSTAAAAATEQMSTNMHAMAASSEQMSTNVKVVAAAVEQMTASISEVARNAEQAAQVAGSAAKLAESSHQTIADLGQSANAIGKVTEVIQDIAEQTKLLALNATIEAARAGDAGKGFAVVATEVKELARQTAAATDDIRKRIEGIQTTTGKAIHSIDEVSEVIQQVSKVSVTIASAVEEQSITTKEIAKNVAQTSSAVDVVARGVAESAKASQEISQNIVGVDEAAKQSSSGARQTIDAGAALTRLAGDLQTLVGQFKVSDGGTTAA